mgnify:CR=1 FL=1
MESKDSKGVCLDLEAKGMPIHIAEGKEDEDDVAMYAGDTKEVDPVDYPGMEVTKLTFVPSKICPVDDSLEIAMQFDLDRDVIAGFWSVQLLVDSCDNRIIKKLGETEPEDYPAGENEMEFKVSSIPVDDIPPSTLTNSGLLMCSFNADGIEVATVNCVVNVFKADNGEVVREMLSPLE